MSGGYGEDSYVNSLDIFCSTAKKLCMEEYPCWERQPSNSERKGTERSYAFVFSPHPGYTSTFEAKLFEDSGCGNYVRILPEMLSISTAEMIVSSNVSVSQCSTVGGQSLSVGKQMLNNNFQICICHTLIGYSTIQVWRMRT
jgi:hypothetical protein